MAVGFVLYPLQSSGKLSPSSVLMIFSHCTQNARHGVNDTGGWKSRHDRGRLKPQSKYFTEKTERCSECEGEVRVTVLGLK